VLDRQTRRKLERVIVRHQRSIDGQRVRAEQQVHRRKYLLPLRCVSGCAMPSHGAAAASQGKTSTRRKNSQTASCSAVASGRRATPNSNSLGTRAISATGATVGQTPS